MNTGLFIALTAVGQIMAADKEDMLRQTIVQVEDEYINEVLQSKDLILYTFVEVPKAYQNWSTVSSGIHDPHYNISGGADHGGVGNAVMEFPWNVPMGTHRVQNVRKFRGLYLPVGKDGRRWPIVYWRQHLSQPRFVDGPNTGYRALHPGGAMYFEFLTTKDSKGRDWMFEIRVRIREGDEWGVDVFRPVATWEDLVKAIENVPDWRSNAMLAEAHDTLKNRPKYVWSEMRDSRAHSKAVINEAGWLEVVSPLPEDFVISLLNKEPWESVLGVTWRSGKTESGKPFEIHAASSQSDFGIVPANYQAGLVSVDRESCARCHDTSNKKVSWFGPLGRDWYGQTPGLDGQFTMHPFHPSCISKRGNNLPVVLRRDMLEAGMFEEYDRSKHPASRYKPTAGGVE